MSKHQIIYTSCMRGINSVNDGQQIYSYDASFSRSTSDDVKALFTYQVPSLEPGVMMTDELASAMPQAFLYRRLGDGTCAMVLNTYLGRDYMGSAGRFGNHLSHVVICDEQDMAGYPCEFYGSELFRSRMEFSEVNSPDKPPYLPEPVLAKGYTIDTDSVIEFLSIDSRMDIFRKMLSAMLAFESARKRVVICDEPENIVMWIAALHYALPLKAALNVNFATYDYDPSLSASQICGVIPRGSRYSAENAAEHFTFDLYRNIMPDIEAAGEFFDFVEMGMSLSYESLEAFHEFVAEKNKYFRADEQYYNAYFLYCLFLDGLEYLPLESFRDAIQFSNDYAPDTEKANLAKKLLSEKHNILSLNDNYSLEVIKALLSYMSYITADDREQIKQLIVEKAMAAFSTAALSENEFMKLYKELELLCQGFHISIPCELMKEANRNTLITSLRKETAPWKWEFIFDLICNYILQKPVAADELSMDFPTGHLIRDIVLSVFDLNDNLGFSLLTRILDKFSGEWTYLSNMALNIEGILLEFKNPEGIISAHWQYFYQTAAVKQSENRQSIYAFFLSYDRYEQILGLYGELLTAARSTREAKNLFNEQVQMTNTKYVDKYCPDIHGLYYDFLITNEDTDTVIAKRELLQAVMKKGITPPYMDELTDSVIADIPLTKPSRENEKLIEILLEYCIRQKHQMPAGRFLLLVSGMMLSEIETKEDFDQAVREIRNIAADSRIDLSGSERIAEEYLNWVVPPIFAASESAYDLLEGYKLFRLSQESSNRFISLYAKDALKESKGDKEFFSILAFLYFIFNVDQVDINEIGKMFGKLGKQKLESLDSAVKLKFRGKRSYLAKWEEIREIAASANPLLNSLGNLFRRKGK